MLARIIAPVTPAEERQQKYAIGVHPRSIQLGHERKTQSMRWSQTRGGSGYIVPVSLRNIPLLHNVKLVLRKGYLRSATCIETKTRHVQQHLDHKCRGTSTLMTSDGSILRGTSQSCGTIWLSSKSLRCNERTFHG